MFKNILLTTLIGFALLTITACTDSKDAEAGKCSSEKVVKTKCDSAPKPVKKCTGS